MDADNKPVYAIDIVSDLIRAYSGTEPVFFQRDGNFFAASNVGFGWLGHGLSTTPKDPERLRYSEKEDAEILESEDIRNSDEERKIKKNELNRVKPLIFGPDHDCYSLENMFELVEEISKLKDDGKIRMLTHGVRYRSHKYGYASDGEDVGLNSGRVIDRKRYFELMRLKEEGLYSGLERVSEEAKDEPEFGMGMTKSKKDIVEMAYDGTETGRMGHKPFSILDALVITPDFLITFPRNGTFDYRGENKTWTEKTEFNGRGGVLKFRGVGTGSESPFSSYYRTNSFEISGIDSQDFGVESEQIDRTLAYGRKVISEFMPKIQQYVGRLNKMNNQAYSGEIAGREKRRQEDLARV